MGKCMVPEDYFDTFVQGNYEDFVEKPECVRRGFNAAIAANHMADHYYKYCEKNRPERVAGFANFKEYVAHVNSETGGHFGHIRAIANAYKHLYTWESISISSAGAIEAVHVNDKELADVAVDFEGGRGKWSVVFTTRKGEQRKLMVALEAVVKFWEKEIVDSEAPITVIGAPAGEEK